MKPKTLDMMTTLKWLIAPLWLITLVAVACMKKSVHEEPVAQMKYINLDLQIKNGNYANIDADGDGHIDFTFYTQLVGDPVLKRDRLQFLITSKIDTKLLNNEADQSPRLTKGDRIGLNHNGYNWFEVSSIVLAEKITPLNGKVYWEGAWKNAAHHYLPIQIIKDAKQYLGWIEISFDTNNQILSIHTAATSIEEKKEVIAGY